MIKTIVPKITIIFKTGLATEEGTTEATAGLASFAFLISSFIFIGDSMMIIKNGKWKMENGKFWCPAHRDGRNVLIDRRQRRHPNFTF